MRTFLFPLIVTMPLLHGQDVFSGIQTFDFDFEALHDSDIDVLASSLSYEQERGDWTFGVGFSETDYSIDYAPKLTLGGDATDLSEATWSGNLSLGRKLSDDWEVSFGARAYEGFADYRSIWIAEYYRQTFNFPNSGYTSPDPAGWSLTTGFVWSPSLTRQVALDFTYGNDTIAPGWTFQQPSNDLLVTKAAALRWQETLNPRLKTETSLSFSDITDRQHRVIVQSAWNFAITDDLTLRAHAGGGKENPSFSSAYGGLGLSYAVNENWTVGAVARIYDDSGEIENSGFNSAAPGLSSKEFGLSARYTSGEHSVSLSVSYFDSNYAPVDVNNDFFANLYRDREFGVFRLAYTREF